MHRVARRRHLHDEILFVRIVGLKSRVLIVGHTGHATVSLSTCEDKSVSTAADHLDCSCFISQFACATASASWRCRRRNLKRRLRERLNLGFGTGRDGKKCREP